MVGNIHFVILNIRGLGEPSHLSDMVDVGMHGGVGLKDSVDAVFENPLELKDFLKYFLPMQAVLLIAHDNKVVFHNHKKLLCVLRNSFSYFHEEFQNLGIEFLVGDFCSA